MLSPDGARDATDIPAAVRTMALRAGHRPAITLLGPQGRQEQSFASVAQWVAKTAHWLELELLLEPDEAMGIVGPPGWVPAVAALGAWWAGLPVAMGDAAASAAVTIAHEEHADAGEDTFLWGWAFDGSAAERSFAHAVQPFPDTPPPAGGTASHPALIDSTGTADQSAVLEGLREEPATTLGVGPDADATDWLPTTTLRPLLTGRPTVLRAPGVPTEQAAGDNIATWLT